MTWVLPIDGFLGRYDELARLALERSDLAPIAPWLTPWRPEMVAIWLATGKVNVGFIDDPRYFDGPNIRGFKLGPTPPLKVISLGKLVTPTEAMRCLPLRTTKPRGQS